MKRRICVFTGTRAEYGLLKPLLDEIKDDGDLHLQLMVSGTHFSREFGLTYKDIEKDGFKINERIRMLSRSDTPVGLCKSIGSGFLRFSEAYQRLRPDILVVLGDRFEAFAAAGAAMISRIPIAHICGGEATFGLIDEALRHSITKMSHVHFTETETYRKRVVQLGEDPDRVFNVGALGLDNIREMKLLEKRDLEKDLGIKFKMKNLLITFHPVTLENNTSKEHVGNLLHVLNDIKDTALIFTKANADTGGRIINAMIDEYVLSNADKAISFTSMGQVRYLSTMRFVDAVVGNSSSGIIEAPSFGIGTINIGDRQRGRIKPASIIDCDPSVDGIQKAFNKLYSREFQKRLKIITNPYGDGHAARRIKAILKKSSLENILKKEFYDIPFALRGGAHA